MSASAHIPAKEMPAMRGYKAEGFISIFQIQICNFYSTSVKFYYKKFECYPNSSNGYSITIALFSGACVSNHLHQRPGWVSHWIRAWLSAGGKMFHLKPRQRPNHRMSILKLNIRFSDFDTILVFSVMRIIM